MRNSITIAQTVWLEMLRRKDVYIILILQGFFTFLLTTIDAFGSDVPSSYIMDIGLMLAFLLSIALSISMGARQIPNEIRSGTIFTILTKPISRFQFLIGKWIGLWVSILATNMLFYLIIVGVTLSRNYSFNPVVLFQVFTLHSLLLGIVIAMSLFFTMFSSQGAGGTLTGIFVVLCYLFIPRVPNMLAYEEGWRAKILTLIYYLSPHLELFDMRVRVLHGWGVLNSGVFVATLFYGVLLTATFILLAWVVFRKKYFKRGVTL